MFPFWPYIPGVQRTDIQQVFLVKVEEHKFAARRRSKLLIFHIKASQCFRELWLGFTDKCNGKKVASRGYAGDKSSRNQCVRSKEDVNVFRYLWHQHDKKSKTDIEFSRVSLWNSVIYKTSSQFYCSGKRHKTTQICQNRKKLLVQTLLLSCLKFVAHSLQCAVKSLDEGNSRKSQIKS